MFHINLSRLRYERPSVWLELLLVSAPQIDKILQNIKKKQHYLC